MLNILIATFIVQRTKGVCIKLQNFNTSKGELEGAYLNSFDGADGLNFIAPPTLDSKG